MMGHNFDANAGGQVEPVWRHYNGKRVVLHALEGSYATKLASSMLQQAERITEELEKLLEPTSEHRKIPVEIYITDPVAQGYATADAADMVEAVSLDTIVRVVRPEDPGDSLSFSLTRLLVARWIGMNAVLATPLLYGIAGVVAARAGMGATIPEINKVVRTKVTEGHFTSIFASSGEVRNTEVEFLQSVDNHNILTSFVAFLITTFGESSLRQFLAAYDPQRQDQAAVTVYHRPLGSLEEAWQMELQRHGKQGTALGTFFRRLLPFLKPYVWSEVEVLLYIVIGIGYNVILPLSGKYLIDTVIPQKNVSNLVVFILSLFGLFVLNALLGMRRSQVSATIVQKMQLDLQAQVFSHMQKLSHEFYAEAKVGDLMSRFSNDLQLVQQAWVQVTGTGIFMLFNVVTAAVVLIVLSPLIGGLTLIVIPLLVFSFMLLGSRFEKASSEQQTLVGEVATATQENISAHAVIKAFGLEQSVIASYHARLLLLLKSAVSLKMLEALFETSIVLATSIGQLLILGIGGYLVIRGNFTVGTMLAAWGLLPALFFPVASLASVVETIQTASGAMDRIVELLDRPADIFDRPGADALHPISQMVKLEHITFGYGKGQTVLHDLSLTIPVGANVAIVGPSGSGKSSIVNLLLRFWDCERGSILFDGQDIRNVTLASLREQVGLVFQDTFIFDTTLRENIAIGRLGATDSEIMAAAKGAQLDSYINTLPAGYNTMLGERGVRMSGGQRQRLAIARVLLRNPRILILDEATSALDPQTEREILAALDQLKQGRTTISITHRFSIAASADYIFVLNQGRLVEQGKHDTLVKAGGLYQQLYEEQTGSSIPEQMSRIGIDITRLNMIPLFAGLRGEVLYKLADRLMKERFAAGEDVVRQGDPGDKLYIISRGQAEVLFDNGSGEQRLNVLNENDYFGEMALLSNELRTATVRTTMPTEFYSLRQADFLLLLDHDPNFRRIVLEKVAERRKALEVTSKVLSKATSLATYFLSDTPTTLLGLDQATQKLSHTQIIRRTQRRRS